MDVKRLFVKKWRKLYVKYIIICFLCVDIPRYIVVEASDQAGVQNPCILQNTCGNCIAQHPKCAWCFQEGIDFSQKKRCDLIQNVLKYCKGENIMHPSNEMEKLTDLNLTEKGSRRKEVIQIKPQEIRLKLRPHSPMTIPVTVRQSTDYPVDLYYVMDLSNSMSNDKEKLAELGDKLADSMGSITRNFTLGFGSFVDKVAAPYVSTHPEKLKHPCDFCAAPYGFRNNMPLSLKTREFAKKVNESKISGNLDGVEGGFDAIMQAIVCKEEIGWRNKSRKLLVVSTDNGFHLAGDGKLAGIMLPNDGECHLNKHGYYTMTAEMDYPSLSQINKKIKENKVTIIFAVTKNQVELYKKLNERLEGSSTGMLEGNSSNIVQLIQDQYNKITSSVELIDNTESSSNVKISYASKCLGDVMRKTNICNNLTVGTDVTFNVTIEITNCPKHGSAEWNKTLEIYPIGLSDTLKMHLEAICECECEKPWNEELSSSRCSGNGTYECGVCSCSENFSGKICECDERGTDYFVGEAACYNGNDTEECSNQGKCKCGTCMCNKRANPDEKIFGTFCECDNFSCDNKCNGHGECVCGKCICHNGWSKSDCSCNDDISNCMNSNKETCSGHGKCDCGECECEPGYFGKYCDDCLHCIEKCKDIRPCVDCFFSNMTRSETERNCSFYCNVHPVETLQINGQENEKGCTFEDEQNCRFTFKYKIDEQNQPIVYVKKMKECPLPVNVMAIVSGVTGSIVGAGLLLLFMWKLLTTVHDRRELAKFEKERAKTNWDTGENPIYIQATSTFKNPVYGDN